MLSDLQRASSATVSSLPGNTSQADTGAAYAACEFVTIALEGMGGVSDESPDLLNPLGYPVSTSVSGCLEAVAVCNDAYLLSAGS